MIIPPVNIEKESKKGSGFGRIVIANDNLRAQLAK
ncbi:hypothetical protein J2Z47_002875 [Cohnella thailandensis]|nr:hypothetical protein [Cohnella thailandensis]